MIHIDHIYVLKGVTLNQKTLQHLHGWREIFVINLRVEIIHHMQLDLNTVG